MNRAQMTAPFAEEELRQFEGRGGKTMTFIEDETVMDRLDAGYGYGNWQLQVEEARVEGVVKVRLGVRENGEWAWYEDFGYPNQKGGDELKEAVSDGIRRCGRYLGIARDLYRKSTYEPGGALGPKSYTNAGLRDTHDGGLIGTAEIGKARDSDFELRKSGDDEHFALGFRLTNGTGGFKVLTRDELALQLLDLKEDVIGKRITVFGRVRDETFTNKSGRDITYQVIDADRVKTAVGTLPVMPRREDEPEPVPVAEGQVAFDLAESLRLDAEEATV